MLAADFPWLAEGKRQGKLLPSVSSRPQKQRFGLVDNGVMSMGYKASSENAAEEEVIEARTAKKGKLADA